MTKSPGILRKKNLAGFASYSVMIRFIEIAPVSFAPFIHGGLKLRFTQTKHNLATLGIFQVTCRYYDVEIYGICINEQYQQTVICALEPSLSFCAS